MPLRFIDLFDVGTIERRRQCNRIEVTVAFVDRTQPHRHDHRQITLVDFLELDRDLAFHLQAIRSLFDQDNGPQRNRGLTLSPADRLPFAGRAKQLRKLTLQLEKTIAIGFLRRTRKFLESSQLSPNARMD